MPPPDSDPENWFKDNVDAHAAPLRLYLRSRFPDLPDIENLMQDSFARVAEAHRRHPINCVRAFLFATARNLALDYYRRKRVVDIDFVAEIDALPVYDDAESIPEVVAKNQELDILTQAIKSLPDRCRKVFTLRKIYGLSQKQIASQLGIAEHTVEAHVTSGMRRCTLFLARHGLP